MHRTATLWIVVVAALVLSAKAHAQGFNVDLGLVGEDPIVGGGAPSAFFGAAAGQVGTWTEVEGASIVPAPLLDLNGAVSGVQLTISSTRIILTSLGFNKLVQHRRLRPPAQRCQLHQRDS
jgi:hypothetical protein